MASLVTSTRGGAVCPPTAANEADFPMLVVPVAAMIEMCEKKGLLPSHEQLQQRGLLVTWRAGMTTIFVSHTWLSRRHPDPHGGKRQLLGELLQGFVTGTIAVWPHWAGLLGGTGLGSPAKRPLSAFQNGFVWLDYMSLPQENAQARGCLRHVPCARGQCKPVATADTH